MTGTARRQRARGVVERLRIDPVACDGIGMCGFLAPALVRLDPWGYPVLTDQPLSPAQARRAAAAVAACPRRALFLAGAPE